jgi:hypothetical protein
MPELRSKFRGVDSSFAETFEFCKRHEMKMVRVGAKINECALNAIYSTFTEWLTDTKQFFYKFWC